MDQLIITIDGPAGSGKSTVARQVAKLLRLEFLDTGAMYRGLAALCVDQGIEPLEAPDQVEQLARESRFFFDWQYDPPRLLVERDSQTTDLTDRLRSAPVTALVSPVASIGPVRSQLVATQQKIGQSHRRLVTEGRDQGSAVFPGAAMKFFLDASPQVRARRRTKQLAEAGRQVDENEILNEILIRDERDSNRADGPLICPAEAMRIDTSDMTLDEVIDLITEHVRSQVGEQLQAGS
jgi:cytidylate kinase